MRINKKIVVVFLSLLGLCVSGCGINNTQMLDSSKIYSGVSTLDMAKNLLNTLVLKVETGTWTYEDLRATKGGQGLNKVGLDGYNVVDSAAAFSNNLGMVYYIQFDNSTACNAYVYDEEYVSAFKEALSQYDDYKKGKLQTDAHMTVINAGGTELIFIDGDEGALTLSIKEGNLFLSAMAVKSDECVDLRYALEESGIRAKYGLDFYEPVISPQEYREKHNSFFESLPEKEQEMRGYYRKKGEDGGAYIVEIEPIGNGMVVLMHFHESVIGNWDMDLGRWDSEELGEHYNWEIAYSDEVNINNDVYYDKLGGEYDRVNPDQCKGQHVPTTVSTDYYYYYDEDEHWTFPDCETCKIEYNNVVVEKEKSGDGIFDADFSYTIGGKKYNPSNSVQLGHVLVTDSNSSDIDFWIILDNYNGILHYSAGEHTHYSIFSALMSADFPTFTTNLYRICSSDHLVKGDDPDIISGSAKGKDWAEAYAEYIRENTEIIENNWGKHRTFSDPDIHSGHVSFAYLDEDDVPEMVIGRGGAEKIVSYKNGDLVESKIIGYAASYIEKKNVAVSSGISGYYVFYDGYGNVIGRGGSFYDGLRFKGYYINEESVSMEESVAWLKNQFDVRYEKKFINESLYTCDSAISRLSRL